MLHSKWKFYFVYKKSREKFKKKDTDNMKILWKEEDSLTYEVSICVVELGGKGGEFWSNL